MRKSDILVLGVGNLLMNDEGVGIHVIQELEKGGLSGVELMDGGTGGFHLLGFIQTYRVILFIDAALDDFPAGTVRVLHPTYAKDFPKHLSAHEIGLKDLIEATFMLGDRPDFYLVAISVKDFQDMGMELSPEVAAAVPVAAQKVVELVEILCN